MEKLSIQEKIQKLATGENVDGANRNFIQIKLAIQLYARLVRFVDIEKLGSTKDTEDDEIMNYWENNSYSQTFSEIEKSEEFKEHPRVRGDISLLTVDDIISFKETGKLPK